VQTGKEEERTMRVKNLMVSDVKYCDPDTNLATASEMFWKHDCGILPVIEQDQIAGVVTDRDICIALGTRNERASNISVASVLSGDVFSCSTEDDVKTALETMRSKRVRRLPVTDAEGKLVGILSLDDVVCKAQIGGRDLSYSDVVDTYKALFDRQLAVLSTAG
jgi:CBS domain-containing protein